MKNELAVPRNRTTGRQTPADGTQQSSQLGRGLLVAAYLAFAGGTLLLVMIGVVTTVLAVLPSGPLGVLVLFTGVVGLIGAAPTVIRLVFVKGLDVIEGVVRSDTDSALRPAYDEEIALALQVLALHDSGQSETAIEAVTGVPHDAIDAILARRDEFLATAAETAS